MDTEKLQVLLEIADTGSVQGAARRLGVTRSSLRRSLDGLEAEIGVRLLHRNAKGVQLTAAGALLVAQGRALLESSRAILEDVRAAAREPTGTIRVFEPIGMPVSVHAQGLVAMRSALPNQRVVIRQFEDPLDHIHEPFDLMLHEGMPPTRSTWFTRVVMRVQLRLFASSAYLDRRGTPRDASELNDHDTLSWKRSGQPVDAWPLLDGSTVPVSPWLSCSDPLILRAVAQEGGGIMLAPDVSFFDEPGVQPMQKILADQVGAELVFRVSSPYPSREDSRTHGTTTQLLQVIEKLARD